MSTIVLFSSAPSSASSLASAHCLIPSQPQVAKLVQHSALKPSLIRPEPRAVVLALPAPSNVTSTPVRASVSPAPTQAPSIPLGDKPKFVHEHVKYRTVRYDDEQELNTIMRLEAESFPPEEAESPEAIRHFAKCASPFFMVATYHDEIVGYIFGTLTRAEEISYDAIKNHDEDGSNLYIHSVVIKKNYRGGGFGRKVLDQYLRQVKENSTLGVSSFLLLAKQHLVPFYESAGFKLVREATNIEMGVDQWFECRLDIEIDPELIMA